FGPTRPTFAQAIVQPTMEPIGKQLGVFQFLFHRPRFGMLSQPLPQFHLPLHEFVWRDRVRQPERNEISATILPPMRQMTTCFSDRRMGIKRLEWQDRHLAGL